MSAIENTTRELTEALNAALGESVRLFSNGESVSFDLRGHLERQGNEFAVNGVRFNVEAVDTIGRGPNGQEIITIAL